MGSILVSMLQSSVGSFLPLLLQSAAGAVYPKIIADAQEGESLVTAFEGTHPLVKDAAMDVATFLTGGSLAGSFTGTVTDIANTVAPLIGGLIGSLSASDASVTGIAKSSVMVTKPVA